MQKRFFPPTYTVAGRVGDGMFMPTSYRHRFQSEGNVHVSEKCGLIWWRSLCHRGIAFKSNWEGQMSSCKCVSGAKMWHQDYALKSRHRCDSEGHLDSHGFHVSALPWGLWVHWTFPESLWRKRKRNKQFPMRDQLSESDYSKSFRICRKYNVWLKSPTVTYRQTDKGKKR